MDPYDPQCMDQEINHHDTKPCIRQLRNKPKWDSNHFEDIRS